MKTKFAIITLLIAAAFTSQAADTLFTTQLQDTDSTLIQQQRAASVIGKLLNITSAPGATPSPSPAQAVAVQGIAGATVIGANVAQVGGSSTVATVTGVQNVLPVANDGATGLARQYSGSHITTKTTTTPTAATAYVSSISICVTSAGTTWTLDIKDKQGTAQEIYTSAAVAVGNTYINFQEPIKMTSGIDIVTGGTTAGTMDVKITYWQ